jgi:hypothetical protein
MMWLHAIALILMMAPALAADLEREKAVADKITANLKTGEAVWLESEGGKFLGLFTPATRDAPKGAALLLHDLGGNPDQPGVVAQLRAQFPQGGWVTLSIQLPLLPADAPQPAYGATLEEAKKRIAAGVNHLKGQGKLPIVLIGHGLGAATGLLWIASEQKPPVAGLAAASLPVLANLDPPVDLNAALEKTKLPILDIFGKLDGDAQLAPKRSEAARKAKNAAYAQIEVTGADRDFTGMDDILARRIRGWAEKTIQRGAGP